MRAICNVPWLPPLEGATTTPREPEFKIPSVKKFDTTMQYTQQIQQLQINVIVMINFC